MTKYFIKLNEEQKGPYTIDELKEMKLTDQYSYWTDGYSTWRKITEIQELDGFILKLPPTIDPNQAKLDEITRTNKQRSLWGIISFAVVLFYFFGGFSDKYALLENYRGLASSSYGDEAAMKVRAILAVIALLISGILVYLIYFQQMYSTYKKLHENKGL